MSTEKSAKKTAHISVHTSRQIKETIQQAAAIKACSMSKYIFDICIENAQRIVAAEVAKLEATSANTKTKQS